MILETAQMLCTVRNEQGFDSHYKSFNPKHPCTKWAAASAANYEWLILHGLSLCDEYTKRYGKTHKSQVVIEQCLDGQVELDFAEAGLTAFAQALPDEYRDPDPVVAYRSYYTKEKAYFAKWDKLEGSQPEWFKLGVA